MTRIDPSLFTRVLPQPKPREFTGTGDDDSGLGDDLAGGDNPPVPVDVVIDDKKPNKWIKPISGLVGWSLKGINRGDNNPNPQPAKTRAPGEKTPEAAIEKFKKMGFNQKIIDEFFKTVEIDGQYYIEAKVEGYEPDIYKGKDKDGEYYYLKKSDGSGEQMRFYTSTYPDITMLVDSNGKRVKVDNGDKTEVTGIGYYDKDGKKIPGKKVDFSDFNPNVERAPGEKTPEAAIEKFKKMGFDQQLIDEYFQVVEIDGQYYMEAKVEGYDSGIYKGKDKDGEYYYLKKSDGSGEQMRFYTSTHRDISGLIDSNGKIVKVDNGDKTRVRGVSYYDANGNKIPHP